MWQALLQSILCLFTPFEMQVLIGIIPELRIIKLQRVKCNEKRSKNSQKLFGIRSTEVPD